VVGDINGDGLADIVGFGSAGTYVSLATGGGNFGPVSLGIAGFGSSPVGGGWTSNDAYPRLLGDVNGDGMADIVGFGSAGTYVSLATGGGNFASAMLGISGFGSSPAGGGWTSDDAYPRVLGDVNGDGLGDIVGFGSAGTYVSLATGDGHFASAMLGIAGFGSSPAGGGWTSDNAYPRLVADVNGDGKADIVGFGNAGVYVALATSGGNFGESFLALTGFGAPPAAGGWSSEDLYPREIADINGDGRADIVGFGGAGVYFALGNSDGSFGPVTADLASFGASAPAGGWTSDNIYPRLLGDVTGDHRADIIAFASDGTYVSQSHDFLVV
jgi:hypothetical protein